MRKNSQPFPDGRVSSKSLIDPIYKVFWNLPTLEEPPPTPDNPSSNVIALSILFTDAYKRVANLEAWVRGVIYSRWSALKYTDAVSENVAVKLYIEDILRPSLESTLISNFVDPDKDVLWFSAPPLERSDDGFWGHLGKQMCPYWDTQLADYDRILVWDADTFFLPRPHTMFTKLKSLESAMIGYIFAITMPWKDFYYTFKHKLRKDTRKSGIEIEELLAMSDIVFDEFPETIQKPFGSMWSYPPKHYHTHHQDFVQWMQTYAPYYGNDELAAVCWSHKFGINIKSLDILLDLRMYDTPSFLTSPDTHTQKNVLHGLPSVSREEVFRETLKIM